VLPRPGLVRAADHGAALVLHRDRGLVRELAARRLAALDALPRRSREALALTLLAWLAHQGRPKAVAAALHVHEQTVRYRLARLREILGDALEDPDARFELELALRATLGPAGGAQRAAKGTTAMTA
jgi:DNA-binding PucR family transcriptional regulator